MARRTAPIEQRLEEIVHAVRARLPVTAIYLYGSQLTGSTHEWSDIDIAVFSPAVEGMSLWEIIDLEAAIQDEVGYDVDIWLYSDRKLEEAKHNPGTFVAHILRTGKRIA